MNPEGLLSHRDRVTFRNRLLRWYDAHARDLPWRETNDAYRIWVSEIMLQQTRVGAVIEHYRRFLERFPTVETLARARQQTVLAAWSGLGYYRRARNLHAAAKVVAFEYGGKFPRTAEELLQLSGIGRYTAAAIASIAYGERAAVVDGNVERVLQRVTGTPALKNAELWNLAENLLSPKHPGDFNQAMMEIGATICLPREPKCPACPIVDFCATRGPHSPSAKEVRNQAAVAYRLLRRGPTVYLVQRSHDASLMAGMWELPQIAAVNDAEPTARFKHSILDTDYSVDVFTAGEAPAESGHWIKVSRLPRIPLTGLARKILRHFHLL